MNIGLVTTKKHSAKEEKREKKSQIYVGFMLTSEPVIKYI